MLSPKFMDVWALAEFAMNKMLRMIINEFRNFSIKYKYFDIAKKCIIYHESSDDCLRCSEIIIVSLEILKPVDYLVTFTGGKEIDQQL